MSSKSLKFKGLNPSESTAFLEVSTTQKRIFTLKNTKKTQERLKNMTPNKIGKFKRNDNSNLYN